MGDCDPVAETGRADPLALGDRADNFGRVDAEPLAGELPEQLEQAPLVRCDQSGLDRLEIDEFGEIHDTHSNGIEPDGPERIVASETVISVARLDPADGSVAASIDHVEGTAPLISEH